MCAVNKSWSMASSMSSKLEPVIWSRDTGHIGIHGGVDVGRTVTKTKLSDGLPYFLNYGAPRARSSAIIFRVMVAIGLIHDSRHVDFQIVMQISHVLCWGANTGKKAICGKSASRNIETTLLKVHFRI